MHTYRKAVLIIHGFAGGTYDQEPLFFYLQPRLEFDVYNFTLPGHRTNLSTDVKYQDWLDSVDNKINELSKIYNKIYVIGHSMGGVLATYAAIKHPKVAKVVLVAPAFNFLSDNDNSPISKVLKNGPDILKTYQIKEVFSRFLKVSLAQAKEFVKLVQLSQENPNLLKAPTLIIQGLNDNIVPYQSSEKIYNEIHCKKWLIEINGVNHDVFYNNDMIEQINNEIEKFLKKNNYRAKNIRKW